MTSHFARQACLWLCAALAVAWASVAGAKGEDRPSRGFMWEATRGAERVLLFGSIHVGRAASAAAHGADRPGLRDAQVFVFEANVFDAQAALAATQRWAMYAEGRPGLDAHVDAALLARIEKLAERAGGGVPLCCRMKPWMVANTLITLEAMRAGLSPAYGSEAQLYLFAMSSGRPVVEIESIEEQLRLFDEAAVGAQVEYLRNTVETIENGSSRTEIERLLQAWERGDAGAMERLVDEMARSEHAAQRFLAEQIVRGRHPKMVAAIERFARSGRLHLVVIGALHYFGRDGLLQMLRARGYALKRLP